MDQKIATAVKIRTAMILIVVMVTGGVDVIWDVIPIIVIKFIVTTVILMSLIAIVQEEIDMTVIVSVTTMMLNQVDKMNICMKMILIKWKMRRANHCWRKPSNLLSSQQMVKVVSMVPLLKKDMFRLKDWVERQNQDRKRESTRRRKTRRVKDKQKTMKLR